MGNSALKRGQGFVAEQLETMQTLTPTLTPTLTLTLTPTLTLTLTLTLPRFVVEQFETVLRMHPKDAKRADVGRPDVGQRCATARHRAPQP